MSIDPTLANLVNQQFGKFRSECDSLIQTIIGNPQVNVERQYILMIDWLDFTITAIPKENRPPWAEQLLGSLRAQAQKPSDAANKANLLKLLFDNWTSIQQFDYAETIDPKIRFESIYRKHYRELGIKDLFEKVVEQLRAVIESKEIDSLTIRQQLEELIGLLQRNKSGSSFFETFMTLRFAGALLKNITFRLGKDSKWVRLFQGVDDSLKEVNVRWKQLPPMIWQDIENHFDIPALVVGYAPVSYVEYEEPLPIAVIARSADENQQPPVT